jgi:hypothetical protein
MICLRKSLGFWVHIGTDLGYYELSCGHRLYLKYSPHRPDERGMVRCGDCEWFLGPKKVVTAGDEERCPT